MKHTWLAFCFFEGTKLLFGFGLGTPYMKPVILRNSIVRQADGLEANPKKLRLQLLGVLHFHCSGSLRHKSPVDLAQLQKAALKPGLFS